MSKFNVAGVAVAIVKDGKIVHEKGYGVKSVETKQPVDQNTNFEIASNSKAFTTTALAILVDEGKLSWKDKVKKYIPEFTMYNDYVTNNFLIEDLLLWSFHPLNPLCLYKILFIHDNRLLCKFSLILQVYVCHKRCG